MGSRRRLKSAIALLLALIIITSTASTVVADVGVGGTGSIGSWTTPAANPSSQISFLV